MRFLVAAIFAPLRIVPEPECFTFWKSEAQPRLVADPDEGASLDEFPGSYCYFASEWTDGGSPIVLLSILPPDRFLEEVRLGPYGEALRRAAEAL